MPALDRVSLGARAGELLAVIGPSGCGKSTLLAALAGTVPVRGRVAVGGADVTDLPPERRNLGVVFQSYALFPHLSAVQNVAFGPAARGVPRRERERAALDLLARVGLAGLAARKPAELSGGQQQRVALARALAVRPAALLLDEPFANLDRPLHAELRGELLAIQRAERVAAVLVTHDPADALAADRVAVLAGGTLVQVGTPEEVYRRPLNEVAARALGGGTLLPATEFGLGGNRVLVRPEDWRLDPATGPRFAATVVESRFAGAGWATTVRLAQEPVTLPTPTRLTPGAHLTLGVEPGRAWQLPAGGES